MRSLFAIIFIIYNYAYQASFFNLLFYYLVVPPIVHSYYIFFIDTVKHWVMEILK